MGWSHPYQTEPVMGVQETDVVGERLSNASLI